MNKIDLKKSFSKINKNQDLIAIKAEFEAEGNSLEELTLLSNHCHFFNLPLTLKIGGPQAKRDIFEAIQIGANKILAPMVESESALEQFIELFNESFKPFKDYCDCPCLAINIETKLSVDNLEEILDFIFYQFGHKISIVIGRSDLSASIYNNDVNSNLIYNICEKVVKKANDKDIRVTLGGGLDIYSFEAINELRKIGLDSFESRKCTLKINENFNKLAFSKSINNCLNFELDWLLYKKQHYKNLSDFDEKRILSIKNRISKSD